MEFQLLATLLNLRCYCNYGDNILIQKHFSKSIYLIVISKAKSQLISNSITISFNFLKDSMYLSELDN